MSARELRKKKGGKRNGGEGVGQRKYKKRKKNRVVDQHELEKRRIERRTSSMLKKRYTTKPYPLCVGGGGLGNLVHKVFLSIYNIIIILRYYDIGIFRKYPGKLYYWQR